jgi:hypothetical protein
MASIVFLPPRIQDLSDSKKQNPLQDLNFMLLGLNTRLPCFPHSRNQEISRFLSNISLPFSSPETKRYGTFLSPTPTSFNSQTRVLYEILALPHFSTVERSVGVYAESHSSLSSWSWASYYSTVKQIPGLPTSHNKQVHKVFSNLPFILPQQQYVSLTSEVELSDRARLLFGMPLAGYVTSCYVTNFLDLGNSITLPSQIFWSTSRLEIQNTPSISTNFKVHIFGSTQRPQSLLTSTRMSSFLIKSINP